MKVFAIAWSAERRQRREFKAQTTGRRTCARGHKRRLYRGAGTAGAALGADLVHWLFRRMDVHMQEVLPTLVDYVPGGLPCSFCSRTTGCVSPRPHAPEPIAQQSLHHARTCLEHARVAQVHTGLLCSGSVRADEARMKGAPSDTALRCLCTCLRICLRSCLCSCFFCFLFSCLCSCLCRPFCRGLMLPVIILIFLLACLCFDIFLFFSRRG